MIEAVLFDFDGVLVQTVEIHAWAFRTALQQVHPASWARLDEKLEPKLNGLSTREKLRYLTREEDLPEEMHERVWKAKQSLTHEAIEATVKHDIGRSAMLRDLKSVLHKRLACVSNAIRSTTVAALHRAGLHGFFEFVLTNEDVSAQKPSPIPYLEAIRRMDARPDECLAVEDSPHGIASARKSGAHVLSVDSYKDVTFRLVWDRIRALENYTA